MPGKCSDGFKDEVVRLAEDLVELEGCLKVGCGGRAW